MTEFNDRRPTPGQLVIPGMEKLMGHSEYQPPARRTLADKLAAGQINEASPTVQKVLRGTRRNSFTSKPIHPVGHRGSIQERIAFADRRADQYRGRQRWDSLRARVGDESFNPADYPDDDDMGGLHPRTGLPTMGQLDTHDDIGLGRSQHGVPAELSFHGSAASARVTAAKRDWVNLPGLNTIQGEVSATRVHELMDDPGTADSQRVKVPGREELPHVYRSRTGEETVIDGNHRVSADVLQGKLFTEAHVLGDHNIPEVEVRSRRIFRARDAAQQRVDAEGRQGDVDRRYEDLYYG